MGDATRQLSEGLVPIRSLEEFFRDSVDAAMASNHVVVDVHTSHYVVSLLTAFARSEALYQSGEAGPGLRPLALMLADAMAASTEEERNFGLQRLGDVSLFIAGFFSEGLQSSPLDVDYYVHMGGGAYQSLSIHIQGTFRGRAFGEVFAELGRKFQELVDVINEVRDSARCDSNADVLRLYELWLKTGSRRAERLLHEVGVQPNSHAQTKYEH